MNILDLFETPIEDFNLIGNWDKNSSFKHENDRKLLTNPKAQEKIIHKWQNTKVPFNIYLVNSPGAGKFAETGKVNPEWIYNNLKPNVAKQIKISSDAINIIYTNNNGDQRVPMTAWVMAHRFGHAVSRYGNGGNGFYGFGSERQIYAFTEARDELIRYSSMILEQSYGFNNLPDNEKKFTAVRRRSYSSYDRNDTIPYTYDMLERLYLGFYRAIGTMRSAREHELRNEFEFILELLAQYMITGKIVFNPLPTKFRYGNNTAIFNEPNMKDYFNGLLEDLAEGLTHIFDNLMHECVGKIFVM